MTRLLLLVALCTASTPALLRATPSVAFAQQGSETENSQTTPEPPVEKLAQESDWTEQRALLDEANLALERSEYDAARELVGHAIDALIAVGESERGGEWLKLLRSAGSAALRAQDASDAKRAWVQVVDVYSGNLPADHLQLQSARLNLASALKRLGELQGARELEEVVLEVFTRTLSDDHPHVQTARGNLANTFKALGDLEGARGLQQSVLGVYTRTLPEDHPNLQAARGRLADTLAQLGDFQGARALEEAVLEVRARTLPEDDVDLQAARVNLAVTMGASGDFLGARELLESALTVYARTLPKDHLAIQGARQNLALTIHSLGDLQGARALGEAVLQDLARSLPADHPQLQAGRGNLAGTYMALGDFQTAFGLQEAVLEAFSRTRPSDHPDVQRARLNLAETMHALGDLQGARALQEVVLAVRSRTLHNDHPELQSARNNLAGTIKALGDLKGARALEEAVLAVRARTLPADHPELLGTHFNLAVTTARLAASAVRGGESKEDADRDWAQALALVRDGASGARKAARAALWGSAVREAEERVSGEVQGQLGLALSFAAGLGQFERTEELFVRAFELSEATRAAGLAGAALARAPVDPAERERLRAEIRTASGGLADLAQLGATQEEYHQLRGRREVAERELLALARSQARAGVGALDLDADSLARTLESAQALVGFRRYQRSWLGEDESPEQPKDVRIEFPGQECVGAFVLRSVEGGSQLAFIDLGARSAIEDAVQAWRNAVGLADAGEVSSGGASVTEGRGIGLAARPTASGLAEARKLRELVWDPLLAALADAEQVVVALDDVLHLVPLDALPLEDGELLVGDRWQIQTRVALWELLDAPRQPSSQVALVSLGGAAFHAEPLALGAEELVAMEPESETRAETPRLAIALLRGGAREQGFAPLTYTRTEAQGLAEVFAEAFQGEAPALVLDGARASREALVEAAPKARYLHVATHGWFAPESIRSWADAPAEGENTIQRLSGEDTVRGMSPMLLCGLALAGANLPPNAVGRVPGLVTAEELSGLDLTGCELAVLSACDTNVGERRAGQGVASLQKALHMAGARSVITSLWKVPDEATSELMLDFYRRLWVEKKPKHQALWEAKLRLRNARDERGEPLYTTRDWAAWVLTGDPN